MESVTLNKEEIMETYEQDWDNEDEYYKVDESGKMIKVNIVTGDIFEYEID